MQISDIIQAIHKNQVNITAHARREARNDSLLIDEIFFAAQHGEIIEDYPDDKPYPSCLIYGSNKIGQPVHSVWAFDELNQLAILITVYRPDPVRWVNWKERIPK